MDLLHYLKDHSIISEKELTEAVKAIEEQGKTIEEALLDNGIEENLLRTASAEYYQVPAFALKEDFSLTEEILAFIPEESALHYHIIPLTLEEGVLLVGVNDPEDLQIREVLNFISFKHNLPFKMVFMFVRDIITAQASYQNLKGDVTDALVTLETELNNEIAARGDQEKNDNATATFEHIKEDAPVTRIVATILRYAVDGDASDIHIEPSEKKVLVRFRVDGVLETSLELPKNVQMAVSARIKILSSMRLDERRKPQDGHFSATFDGRKIDFRVSILPTNYGENIVMRILDNEKGVSNLEGIGLSGHILTVIRRMLNEPFGIILISGPTGSGKSTTLYAMLAEMDKKTKNVLSLEDPVEYNIEGVSQSQVHPEIGYTFAHGLRSALRQDPDIIMVGEIRDKETAQLAIQAALTGHLVLSTIHTNNSIGVIPRLINMGIDPYLIAPTLKLALAQRLARRIKTGTGREEPINKAMELMMADDFETLPAKYRDRIPARRTILHPEPSPGNATGLKGRIAVMEVLEVSEPIQNLILKNASEEEIYNVARLHGFMSMKEDAIIKALDHIIPYEEMTVFGSKVGMDDIEDEENIPVNNSPQNVNISAIIKNDENTNS